ncbi:hypothetical protein [Streptomyces sp. NPDC052721]|uniref:hypothetical protein n=1 Tax=Streptomyces sp. NPDC052721 TaxID=3154955 RepID=UPI00342BF4B4
MTKPRLTEEEHLQIGKQLARMQTELATLHSKLGNAYPLQGREGQPLRKLDKVENTLRDLRYALENALISDHPQADTSVYFPKL